MNTTQTAAMNSLKSWKVTMRTGENKWTTSTFEAASPAEAIAIARRVIGGKFVEIV